MPCCRMYGPRWAVMVHISGALVRRTAWYLLFAGYGLHWLSRWALMTIAASCYLNTLRGPLHISRSLLRMPGSILWDRRITWMLSPLAQAYRIDPQKRSSFQLASCWLLTAQDADKPWNGIKAVSNKSEKDLFSFLKGPRWRQQLEVLAAIEVIISNLNLFFSRICQLHSHTHTYKYTHMSFVTQ